MGNSRCATQPGDLGADFRAVSRKRVWVRVIGVGHGDSIFWTTHTLPSFPTHDPRKGKRIRRP
jgi:hypothetical protein